MLIGAAALAAALAAAPPAAAEVDATAAARARLEAERDRLQDELALLRALKRAQRRALEWLEVPGAEPRTALSPKLCARPGIGRWCARLPATFGAGEGEIRQ